MKQLLKRIITGIVTTLILFYPIFISSTALVVIITSINEVTLLEETIEIKDREIEKIISFNEVEVNCYIKTIEALNSQLEEKDSIINATKDKVVYREAKIPFIVYNRDIKAYTFDEDKFGSYLIDKNVYLAIDNMWITLLGLKRRGHSGIKISF